MGDGVCKTFLVLLKVMLLLLGLFAGVEAQDQPVLVQIDCRESIGLLPSFWRGLRLSDGRIPDGLSLRTAHLDPSLVGHAWDIRRRGGSFDWAPLDRAINALRARGVGVVLALPSPEVQDALWEYLIDATVRHTTGRVELFEFQASPSGRVDTYLDFFQTGAWAVYQADNRVRIGGPGLDWEHPGVAALVRRCTERRLPLHVVTWEVLVTSPQDPVRSAVGVQELIDRYRPMSRPERMITGWRLDRAGEDALSLGLSALMSAMASNVLAICLADTGDAPGLGAMRALNHLEGVRLPVSFQESESPVSALANLEHDTVTALFWQKNPGNAAEVKVSFKGLPLGRHIRVERFSLSGFSQSMEPVFSDTQVFREPFEVEFILRDGLATLLRLVVE